MMRLSTCAFVAALIIGGCGAPTSSAGSGAARPAASVGDFTLDGIDGKPYSLSDYVGRDVVLVAFWATWCEPCKRKTVQHQELYDKYGAQGFVVLAVSMDEPETQGQVRLFARQRELTFPVLLDTESQAVQLLNPRRTAPFTVLFGRDGRIAWEHEGWVSGDEKTLEDEVVKALAAK
ncbi:MAG: TlpA family protein disulfide reductase [Proteobacteria bacterium]|jgi:peroxiredoxin|nr:TlpA family protein disulfide reductase [Pseudomonadota bacterium]